VRYLKKSFLLSMLVTMACTSSAPPQQQLQTPQKLGDEEKTGNGGNIIRCSGQLPVVLDFYNATIPTLGAPAPTLVDISQYTSDQVVDFFKFRFTSFPYFQHQFEDALKAVGPMDTWLSANLKNTKDANETYHLPQGCSQEQAAVRQGTVMYGDPDIINSLVPAQKGLLLVHEALYYIGDTVLGLRTSEKIRSVVRETLKDNSSAVALRAAIYKIGGLVSPFQIVLKKWRQICKQK